MSAEALSTRENWQAEANKSGLKGEKLVGVELHKHLPSHFDIELKPPKIVVYSGGKGIQLDLKVTNRKNNKCVFIEVKTGSNGGNATEERAAKFLSTGIEKKIKALVPGVVSQPVLSVFQGPIFEGADTWRTKPTKSQPNGSVIDPPLYREKVALIFEGHEYSIICNEHADTYGDLAKKVKKVLDN